MPKLANEERCIHTTRRRQRQRQRQRKDKRQRTKKKNRMCRIGGKVSQGTCTFCSTLIDDNNNGDKSNKEPCLLPLASCSLYHPSACRQSYRLYLPVARPLWMCTGCVYICVSLSLSVCMCVCVYVCVCVCVRARACMRGCLFECLRSPARSSLSHVAKRSNMCETYGASLPLGPSRS